MRREAASCEAITLASFLATLLAPLVTGTLIELCGGDDEPINGVSALIGALLEMPGTLAAVWITLYVSANVARNAGWRSFLLIATTAIAGGCVALFRLDAVHHLDVTQHRTGVGVFLVAGAITGWAYEGLISFWDSLLKELAE